MRPVWINLIETEIRGRGVQLPRQRKPLSEMSTEELETLAIKAIKLSINMASPTPEPVSYLQQIDQGPEPRRVEERSIGPYITQVLFVRGTGGANWLISVATGFRISCWEVLSDPVSILPAGRWDSPLPIVDVDANRYSLHEGTLAVTHTTRSE